MDLENFWNGIKIIKKEKGWEKDNEEVIFWLGNELLVECGWWSSRRLIINIFFNFYLFVVMVILNY